MESQIHLLEQEAYRAVLCAFKAQSDAISWEKEGLITELRKELRVSDDEHRGLLNKVNADDTIRRIREWRMAGCPMTNNHHHFNKKQRIPQSATLPYGSEFRSMPPQPVLTTPKPYSDMTRGSQRGQHRSSSVRPIQDPLIGKKVMTRWPEDNNFYEAVIAEYNPSDGRHAFVYDRYTPKETWEWVHLNEIPPADIRFVGEDPKRSRLGFSGGQSGLTDLPSRERERDSSRDVYMSEAQPLQNGIMNKISDNLEILDTDTLLEKVEKVLGSSHPNLHAIEKAKKILKEHEETLIDVIAKLADACDG